MASKNELTLKKPHACDSKVLQIIKSSCSPSWSSLPYYGLNGTVYTMVEFKGKIYAGGEFTSTTNAEVSLNYIAQYNPCTNSWYPLALSGLNGPVYDIQVYNNQLIVVGRFDDTFTLATANFSQNIVKYDPDGNSGSGEWIPFNYGLARIFSGFDDSYVNCVTVYKKDSSDYFAFGGNFTSNTNLSPNTVISRNIIFYRVSNGNWYGAANGGLNDVVNCITVCCKKGKQYLAVGGLFNQTSDSNITTLNLIAFYNICDGVWSPFANDGLGSNGDGPISDPGVQCITVYDEHTLYVGGFFQSVNDGEQRFASIAMYKINCITETWKALAYGGLNAFYTNVLPITYTGYVACIEKYGDLLYVGGDFSITFNSNTAINCVGIYNPSENDGYGNWTPIKNTGISNLPFENVEEGPFGGFGTVFSVLKYSKHELFFGGIFKDTGDLNITNLNSIAKYTFNNLEIFNGSNKSKSSKSSSKSCGKTLLSVLTNYGDSAIFFYNNGKWSQISLTSVTNNA